MFRLRYAKSEEKRRGEYVRIHVAHGDENKISYDFWPVN
nr:hypothetical protein [Klebsiella pneumoniae]